MSDRKLASIRIVSMVEPIEGADNIEKITIDGWQCICKKGEFKPLDKCVYFEIDSFLPIRPDFEFLRKSCYKKMGHIEGFKLRTIKLRGTLSQGLAMPLSILNKDDDPDAARSAKDQRSRRDGDDVTEELGVVLFEKPIHPCLRGKVTNWPSFLRKTDQERVQNIWNKIKDLDETFEVTEKMDGMSCTYYMKGGKFGVCSRNLEIVDTPGHVMWEIARKYNIEDLLNECLFFLHPDHCRDRQHALTPLKNIALQGEVVGEGIQGNPHKINGQDFYLFDIWDIDHRRYLLPVDRRRFAITLSDISKKTSNNRLKHVNVCSEDMNTLEFKGRINHILDYADGDSKCIREGLVFKSNMSDLTFKVISNKYLLKNKE